MEDLNFTDVLQSIQEWCSRPMGTFTVLAILAVIGIVIVMTVKENYGKDSFEYRITCVIATALYAIIALNFTSSIMAWLLSIKWLTATSLAILFIMGLYLSWKKDSLTIAIVSIIITIGCSYGIFQNLIITGVVGIIAIVIVIIAIYNC